MLNITTNQTLDLWSRLEQCYYNDDGYGGNVCEIYEYTLTPRSPGADAAINSSKSIFKDINKELGRAIWFDLMQLLEKFQKDRECELEIDGVKFKDYNEFTRFHRIHVKVIKKEKIHA